jgi:hypothetical protein
MVSIIPALGAKPDTIKTNSQKDKTDYLIEQPGTITFTVGVKILGKVEKPQVVIFLSKEKTTYRDISFTYSFEKNIEKPLPFVPITK